MRAILTYHSLDDSGSPISVTPEVFAAHHAWFASGHVRVLPLEDLVADPGGDDAVALTFDDGFLNVRDAVDRLASDGIPATIFVVSGRVGSTNDWGGRDQAGIPTMPLMSWDDLERLAGRGVAMASHTRSHHPLTRLSPDALDDELLGCQHDLESRFGQRTAHVCYPYGDVDESVAARAAMHYRNGYTTEFRDLSNRDPALRLPRLDMFYFRAPAALEAWGRPAFRRHMRWCQLRRHVRARLMGAGAPVLEQPGPTHD